MIYSKVSPPSLNRSTSAPLWCGVFRWWSLDNTPAGHVRLQASGAHVTGEDSREIRRRGFVPTGPEDAGTNHICWA